MLSMIRTPLELFAKRLVPLAFLLATLVVELSEQCISTATPQSASVPAASAPAASSPSNSAVVPATSTMTPCTCPTGNCGFIIDTDAVTQASIALQLLTSVGSCACAGGESEGCYPAQPDANTNSAADSLLIDLTCPTPASFCVCDVNGNCFTATTGTGLTDLLFYPFQDAGGCNVYVRPFCGADQNDGIGTFTCTADTTLGGIVGSNTQYIKVFSASCRGCSAIRTATKATCAASTFVAAMGKKK